MVPTSLGELSKPSRTPDNSKRLPMFYDPTVRVNIRNMPSLSLFIPSNAPVRDEALCHGPYVHRIGGALTASSIPGCVEERRFAGDEEYSVCLSAGGSPYGASATHGNLATK